MLLLEHERISFYSLCSFLYFNFQRARENVDAATKSKTARTIVVVRVLNVVLGVVLRVVGSSLGAQKDLYIIMLERIEEYVRYPLCVLFYLIESVPKKD